MNEKSTTGHAVRPCILKVSLALGLWAALVLMFASQFVLVGSFAWSEAFRQAVLFWGLWVLFIPAVTWLSFRFPFQQNRFVLNFGIHILACISVVAASQFAFKNFIPPPAPPPDAPRNREAGYDEIMSESPPFKGFLSIRAGFDILVYWTLVGICQGLTNFLRSQQRERREAELEAHLTRSKLQALRMQINPHFLFNTLNAISTLVYVNPRAADDMIGDLSELLRNSLDRANQQEIPLARELGFVRQYVGIEKKRFGDRLQIEEKTDAEHMTAMVPALILQPLVENAIRHGIEPQRAPGMITIESRRENHQLVLRIIDNGRGLVEDAMRNAARPGIGLSNTRARLQELYGANQSLVFGKSAPRGCAVEIRLPYHVQASPSETAASPTT